VLIVLTFSKKNTESTGLDEPYDSGLKFPFCLFSPVVHPAKIVYLPMKLAIFWPLEFNSTSMLKSLTQANIGKV